jgi:hypothetical protein
MIIAETLNGMDRLELFQNFSTEREWSKPNHIENIIFPQILH